VTASATVDRIIDVFPPEQQQQIRIMLADTIQGIVSQQLVQRTDSSGRVAAYELMTRTTSIRSLIREGRTHQIPTAIQTGRKAGMRLLDYHLQALVDAGVIGLEEAVRVATEPATFAQKATEVERETVTA
jgi:twitching motility protein PilT